MARISKPTNKKSLDAMLAEIEAELVSAIPERVKSKNIKEKCYGLLVCYIDLTTDDFAPLLNALPESHRKKCMADGDVATIWNIPEIPTILMEFQDRKSLGIKCNLVYQYLVESNAAKDEMEILVPFRRVIYRVCQKMNAMNWSTYLPVTDDFVVMASDWSSIHDVQADADASIPDDRKQSLLDRGLFFNPQDFRPPEPKAGNPIGKMNKRPVDEQIAYWLRQIEALANGDRCDASEAGWGPKRVAARIKDLGEKFGEPLLAMLERHARIGEWKAGADRTHIDQVGPRCDVIVQLLAILPEVAAKNWDTEIRLWKTFEAVIKLNKGYECWSDVPGKLAFTIQEIFPKYDYWVIREGNRITNLKEIQKAAKEGLASNPK